MAECKGDSPDHCCHLGRHGACEFVVVVDGTFRCSLRASLGSWERVHVDPRYLDRVKPKLAEIGVAVDCGDWPPPGATCATCGVNDG